MDTKTLGCSARDVFIMSAAANNLHLKILLDEAAAAAMNKNPSQFLPYLQYIAGMYTRAVGKHYQCMNVLENKLFGSVELLETVQSAPWPGVVVLDSPDVGPAVEWHEDQATITVYSSLPPTDNDSVMTVSLMSVHEDTTHLFKFSYGTAAAYFCFNFKEVIRDMAGPGNGDLYREIVVTFPDAQPRTELLIRFVKYMISTCYAATRPIVIADGLTNGLSTDWSTVQFCKLDPTRAHVLAVIVRSMDELDAVWDSICGAGSPFDYVIVFCSASAREATSRKRNPYRRNGHRVILKLSDFTPSERTLKVEGTVLTLTDVDATPVVPIEGYMRPKTFHDALVYDHVPRVMYFHGNSVEELEHLGFSIAACHCSGGWTVVNFLSLDGRGSGAGRKKLETSIALIQDQPFIAVADSSFDTWATAEYFQYAIVLVDNPAGASAKLCDKGRVLRVDSHEWVLPEPDSRDLACPISVFDGSLLLSRPSYPVDCAVWLGLWDDDLRARVRDTLECTFMEPGTASLQDCRFVVGPILFMKPFVQAFTSVKVHAGTGSGDEIVLLDTLTNWVFLFTV